MCRNPGLGMRQGIIQKQVSHAETTNHRESGARAESVAQQEGTGRLLRSDYEIYRDEHQHQPEGRDVQAQRADSAV